MLVKSSPAVKYGQLHTTRTPDEVSSLFGGPLLLAGFGPLFFPLPPLGHKPPPSLDHYFGPALGTSGCVFPVSLDLERTDAAFHACTKHEQGYIAKAITVFSAHVINNINAKACKYEGVGFDRYFVTPGGMGLVLKKTGATTV